jgi:hypothetical protein
MRQERCQVTHFYDFYVTKIRIRQVPRSLDGQQALLGFIFNLNEGNITFLRNVGKLLPYITTPDQSV